MQSDERDADESCLCTFDYAGAARSAEEEGARVFGWHLAAAQLGGDWARCRMGFCSGFFPWTAVKDPLSRDTSRKEGEELCLPSARQTGNGPPQ